MLTIETPDLNQGGAMEQLGSMLRLSKRPWAIMQLAAKSLSNELREWFLGRNQEETNKMGWPKQNFWSRIRNATAVGDVSATQAAVSIADPAIRLKIFGGKVEPKRVSSLAIPARAEAYAAGAPREGKHPELEFSYGFDPTIGKFRPALMTVDWQGGWKTISRTNKKTGVTKTRNVRDPKQPGGIWYWLVKSTRHEPDSMALPPVEAMQSAILGSVRTSMMNAALRGVR